MHTMRRALIVLLLCASRPVHAGYAARDLMIPIAGRATSTTRGFSTSVWITNLSGHSAKITSSFLPSGPGLHSQKKTSFDLGPGATLALDPLQVDGFGALRLQADSDIIASARVSSNEVATSFSAVPTRFAIGSGQSTDLQGFVPGSRYKVYVVESSGEPLEYSVILINRAGVTVSEKMLYVDRFEHAVLDVDTMFPPLDAAQVRLEGRNGNGHIIALGLQIPAGSQDGNAFEMSFGSAPRYGLSWPELLTYVVIVAGVVAAALLRR